MNEQQPIEVEATPTQAVAIREQGGAVGILRPAGSLDQIAEAFKEYQRVCEKILNQDDYQTYEGKPRKKKSAWRKLATAFNVSTKKVAENIIRDSTGHVLSAQFTMQAFTPSRIWEAVGYCEINEKCCASAKGQECRKRAWKGHYCCSNGCDGRKHWSHPDHDILSTAQTRATNRAIADLIGCGEVSAEELTDDVSKDETPSGNAPGRAVKPTPPSGATHPPKDAPAPRTAPIPRVPADAKACLAKFVQNLDSEKLREKATQFCIDLAWLMPNEKLEDLPDRFVPMAKQDYVNFLAKLTTWSVSGKAERPYEPHPEPDPKSGGERQTKTTLTSSPTTTTTPPATSGATGKPHDDEWWRDVIVPIPRKGQKRDEYLKNPDTIGSLYEARHGDDEESNALRQRLWGFLNHFEPKGWEKRDGTKMPPSDADIKFREALDAFGEWFEKNHPGEDL